MSTETKFPTYTDYSKGNCTFSELYTAIANEEGVYAYISERILAKYKVEVLKQCYEKDEHFNNISLSWWDSIMFSAPFFITSAFKIHEVPMTLSTKCCLAKEVARMIVNN